MIILDELLEYKRRDLIPEDVYQRVLERSGELGSIISDVECLIGIRYPKAVVKPYLITLVYTNDVIYEANVYARTVVKPSTDLGVEFLVEFTAPLLLFASRDTLKAVVAHEMAHYVELLKRFVDFKLTSEAPPESFFEAPSVDESLSIDPEKLFGPDSVYTKLIRETFNDGLKDEELDRLVDEKWVKKGLPIVRVSVEENLVRLPVESILNLRVDDDLMARLSKL